MPTHGAESYSCPMHPEVSDKRWNCGRACDVYAGWTMPICVWYAIEMSSLRRIIVVALLACVPFQAAIGATGFVCPNGAHHSDSSSALADDHDASTPHQHRAPDASGLHGHALDAASP